MHYSLFLFLSFAWFLGERNRWRHKKDLRLRVIYAQGQGLFMPMVDHEAWKMLSNPHDVSTPLWAFILFRLNMTFITVQP